MKYSICAIIKNEQLFLKEWIDWNLSIGFDSIFLCEDIESKPHIDIVKDYDNVTLISYSDEFNKYDNDGFRQYAFYNWFLKNNPENCDWCALIDVDEFIHIDNNLSIKDLLSNYNDYNGIYLYWKFYNSNGFIIRPNGNILDNYKTILDFQHDYGWKYKSIVNLNKCNELVSVHQVKDGVNTCKLPTNKVITYYKAHIKHYFTKSWQDWEFRFKSRGDISKNHRKLFQFFIANSDMKNISLLLMNYYNHNTLNNIVNTYDNKHIYGLCKGLLGNLMFIIAALKSYCLKHNFIFEGLIYDENADNISDNLKNITTDNNILYISQINPEVPIIELKIITEDLNNNLSNSNVLLLDGYFQNSNYLNRDIILDLFKPSNEIIREIQELYGDLSEVVSVHIRRGDYLDDKNIESGYRSLSKDNVLDIINIYFPNDRIIFTSNDINWCKENFIGEKYIFADKECSNSTVIDLYIPTQCKANIISNSTFSFWGAYLNKNSQKVICPWPWYTNNNLNHEVIIPDKWIKYSIENE